MAYIDVNDLLSDPDFVDPIQVINQVPTVNTYGENTLQDYSFNTIGCVQPASGKTLQRLPEAMRLENVSEFWLKGTITTSVPGKYPAILVFRGQRYQVRKVMDFSNWGAGYSDGICVAELPAP